ncbi:hypothetical protein Q9Q95_19520 [Sphingomonas sp. DG1-23]|uniref:hypothetical protein n=1 Tax=Sphingomonas sp. DG1-23 TaxID=3068316 RepID=UPI00273D90AC|nr:hypothetical protein [Sphingomonas sp. DG1-23]MDP5281123.1 hypothetical protein [Sphingomonas sp. DG1-23]
MHTVLMIAAPIGLVAGGLALTVLLSCLLWQVLKPVRHPEWAPIVIVVLLVLAVTGVLPRSDLLNMVLAFSAVATIPLWIEGRAWRRRRPEAGRSRRRAVPAPKPLPVATGDRSYPLYPAITACLSEGRRPDHDEIRIVASRMWREGFALRFAPHAQTASFAARRLLLRATKAALAGAQ